MVRPARHTVIEIAEAARALSSDATDATLGIPRRALADMRDRTIHRYPEVDLDVLSDTVEHDLPQLEQHIRQHLDDTTSEDAD